MTERLPDLIAKESPSEALEASTPSPLNILDHISEGIVTLDERQSIVFFSKGAERIFGYSAEEIIGQPLDLLLPQRVAEGHRKLVRDFGARAESFRSLGKRGPLTGRRKDGTEFPAEIGISKHAEAGWVLFTAVVSDITERHRAERAVRENERQRSQLAAIVESSDDAIIGKTLDGAINSWNRAAERLYGYWADEVKGRSISIIAPPDRQDEITGIIDRLKRGERVDHFETVRVRKDGKPIHVSITVSPVKDASGTIVGASTIARDITERKRAEETLRRVTANELEQRKSAALRDLTIIAVLSVLVLASAHYFEIFGAVSAWVLRYEPTPLDEVVVVLVFLGFAFMLFAYRRWQEVKLEVVGRQQTEEALRTLHGDLERRVHERTADLARTVEVLRAEITERMRSEQEIQRRGAEFAALYDTSRELAAQRDLQDLLQTIVNSTVKLLAPTTAVIFLYNPRERDLELVAGLGSPLPVGARISLGRGLAGYVALTREPFIVNDYPAWEHRLPQLAGVPIESEAAVPMNFGGELIGVLLVANNAAPASTETPSRKFTEAESRLLELFAGQAASAVHNAQLFEETHARAQQLALLYDAGLTLNRTLDPHTQLEFLFQIAMKALHAERAEYWRCDGDCREARLELSVGYGEVAQAALRDLSFPMHEPKGLIGLVAETRLPLCLGDVSGDPRYLPIDPEVRSGLWVPVERQNELLGVLAVLSTRIHAFSPQDERLLVLFANQAAVAIENGRLFSQTEQGLRRLAALNGIDKAITSSLDLHVTLDIFLDNVVKELHVDAADVLLVNPVTQTLEHAAGRGFVSGALPHTRLRVGEGLAGQAVLERRIVNVPDLARQGDGLRRSPLSGREKFVAYYAAPLICKGQVKGVLEVFHRAPLSPDEEWLGFLETLTGQAAIAIDSVQMFDNLQQSNADLTLAYDTTLEGWIRALDLRDKETEGHTQRVTQLTLDLARAMGMNGAELLHMRRGVLLHDIGKIGIPDSILLKPGTLTAEEWEVMRRHPGYAYQLLSPIAYLRPALDIPYCHHEKWDGTGYPRGLKGDQIPLAARLFAVVDVWDALCSDRPYRPAWSKEQAREYIREQTGKHFDPKVVEKFFETQL